MAPRTTTTTPLQSIEERYRLEETLGAGAFGEVSKAWDKRGRRWVAIKRLHPEGAWDDKTVKRFRREAELARRLDHPNTVRIYDSGQTAAGDLYIAWQYLEGRSLEEELAARGPRDEAFASKIAMQVLRSLMEAHGLGIVHRDIKPGNIFLSRFAGDDDFVKVLDFGIAKRVLAEDEAGETPLTAANQMLGTPAYMAPEQVLNADVGPRADLYALGAVMIELLTGECYGDEMSFLEVVRAHSQGEEMPIPDAMQDSWLAPIVRRATRHDPAQRYADAAEMLTELSRARVEH